MTSPTEPNLPERELSDYTARLLVGTGLDLDSARLLAAATTPPASSPVATALHDGWVNATILTEGTHHEAQP